MFPFQIFNKISNETPREQRDKTIDWTEASSIFRLAQVEAKVGCWIRE